MTIAFLKGHAMNRGTLMVLKRLLVTTLGALGLGALAAGPASAQQIPAPDLFDDQVNCSMHVMPQAAAGNTALGMTLNMHVGMGDAITDADGDGVPDDGSGFEALNAIINPMGSNCSAGFVTNADGEFLDAMGVVTTDADQYVYRSLAGGAAAVGAGYTDSLTAFLAARAADAGVKTADDALKALREDDIDDDIQATTIMTAEETLATAKATQATAHTALYSVGEGPINMAGIAEWKAKFAVEDAVKAYNTAVTGVTDASTALAETGVDYADYTSVDSDQLLALLDINDDINLANVRQYANVNGDNTSTVDADGIVITGDSAFDVAGNLIVPMRDSDTTDAIITLEPLTTETSYTLVKARLDAVDNVVNELTDLQDENQNALLQPVIDEAVERAKTEQAHYQGQFDAMVADTSDLDLDADGDATTMPSSIASRYSTSTAAKTTRDNAGVDLETKFADRVAKTSAVVSAFTSAQDFYQQLVDRREYEKAQKDAEVTRLAGLTGDDAATEAMTMAATTAATNAQTALDAATKAQAAFQGLLADDSPVKALVEELLKSDAAGDDGGALVDAIVGAYDGQDEAAARLDALLTEASTTETMDDDGNTVTMTTPESGRIVDIETSIAGLTGEDGTVAMNTGRIEQNETDIATNVTDIAENRTMIGTNVTNIAANATNIMANTTAIGVERGRIDQNVLDIETNAGDILTNAGSISMNTGRIEVNELAIASNVGDIASNATMIGSNASAIGMNETRIGELSDELDVVRAGVAASMALAGMPAINGRGIAIGVGSFDGESAFAVGFQIQGEMASFQIGVTSSGGETGASAGVGFQF